MSREKERERDVSSFFNRPASLTANIIVILHKTCALQLAKDTLLNQFFLKSTISIFRFRKDRLPRDLWDIMPEKVQKNRAKRGKICVCTLGRLFESM